MSRQSTGHELMMQSLDVILSLALSAALRRQTTCISNLLTHFTPFPFFMLPLLHPSPCSILSRSLLLSQLIGAYTLMNAD